MPNGTTIAGEDGIIKLKNLDDTAIGEVPMLKSWSISSSPSFNSRAIRVMKSNDDGGSSATDQGTKKTLQGRDWSISFDWYWQKNELIPAAEALDPALAGTRYKVEVYPEDDAAGSVVYSAEVLLEPGDISSEVDGDVETSTTLQVDGVLTKARVA